MHKLKKPTQSLNWSMLLHCLLLFIGICAGLWINGYGLLLVAGATIIVSLFGKIESVYYHLLFCLPFTMIYKLSPSSTSLFAYVMLAVGIILMIRVHRYSVVPLLLIALFAIYALFGMGDNFTTVIKMIMGMLLLYVFVKKIDSSDFKNHIIAFSLGMLGSSCIGLLKGSWPHLDMYFSDMDTIYIEGVKSFRFTGLYLDPNYFSVSVIFALTLCLMLFFNKECNRVALGIIIGALTVFGFISYSKMFLLSIFVLVLIFIFGGVKSPRRLIITLFVFVLGGALLYLWMQNGGYLSTMADRLSESDISNGRFYMWTTYINYICRSPLILLFGDGLGAQYLSVGGPHNTYIETVFFIGLLGGTLFLAALLSIFLSRKYNIRRKVVNFALPILFGIMAATLGCLTINDLMFYCILMWIGFNFDTNVNKGKSKVLVQGDLS